jgi:hypothetical protein
VEEEDSEVLWKQRKGVAEESGEKEREGRRISEENGREERG